MTKDHKKRWPFEDPVKRSNLAYSFQAVTAWAEKKKQDVLIPEQVTELQNLSEKASMLMSAVSVGHSPVAHFGRQEKLLEGLAELLQCLDEVRGLPEGHEDRTNSTLRTADRRIREFCKEVISEGGSFSCARPKPNFKNL
jgi:hypothetical protein